MHAAAMEYAAPYLAVRRRGRARPDGLQPRVLAPRPLAARVGRDPLARPRGRRRAGRAELRAAPSRSPRGSPRSRAARSSTTSCSTRCCSGSRATSGRRQIVAAVQQEGEAWMSPTVWDGRRRDPHLGLELADRRRRRPSHGRRLRPRRRSLTARELSPRLRPPAARSASSLTTDGSASVVVSPIARFSATSRSRRRMILPERVFGSSGVKTMLAGFAIAPILFATWLRSSSSISTEPGLVALERHVGDDRLAGRRVGAAADGGLGDLRVVDERRLHLDRRDAVARDVHHVVDPAEQPVVAVGVDPRAVAGEVVPREPRPVGLAEALVVAEDPARHRGPGPLEHEVAAALLDPLALLVEHAPPRRRGTASSPSRASSSSRRAAA